MEICVLFYEYDEFWYINLLNEYFKVSNVIDEVGNGVFWEILVIVDGLFVGVVYLFLVIYIGGVNLYFWWFVLGIGFFVLFLYDVDIMLFLGMLVDGERYKFGVLVMNVLLFWLLGVNLYVWVDEFVEVIRGEMVYYFVLIFFLMMKFEFMEFDGMFFMEMLRVVEYFGWLLLLLGNLIISVEYLFKFLNF